MRWLRAIALVSCVVVGGFAVAAVGGPQDEPAGDSDDEGVAEPESFRGAMRELVVGISEYARERRAEFVVVPQNGIELLSMGGEADGELAEEYVAAIDGVGQEDLFYGYRRDNRASPRSTQRWLLPFLERAREEELAVLVIDYCEDRDKVDDALEQCERDGRGFLSFAAHRRGLDAIPPYPAEPAGVNTDDVERLADANNFLYLINPSEFDERDDFLSALEGAPHDVLIIDAYFNDGWLTAEDVARLGAKPDGGTRLVLSYMSIGEAESYRDYWRDEWREDAPRWLAEENPDWSENYKVRYWDPEWQSLIYGNDEAYLDRILALGFDGAYLDIIDAYEYFEDND